MRLDQSPHWRAVARDLQTQLVAPGQWYRLDDRDTADDLVRHHAYGWRPHIKRGRPWLVARLLSGRTDIGYAYHRTVVAYPRTASGEEGLEQPAHPKRHGCTIGRPGRIRRIDVDMDIVKLLGHCSCTEDDAELLRELGIDGTTV